MIRCVQGRRARPVDLDVWRQQRRVVERAAYGGAQSVEEVCDEKG
jgi:hypothetical protein